MTYTKVAVCLVSIAVGGALAVISNTIQNKSIQYDGLNETIMRDGYPVNENGETYGTVRKDSSIEPDLQLTYKGGYVKQSDINDNVQTIEDALRHNERCKEGRKIPLYKSDGTTVIGEFYIGG